MNDELISILGQFCTELLGDERFKMLTDMFGQQCAADMLATKPEHYKQREALHASWTGFGNFIALVDKFSAANKKLVEEQQRDILHSTPGYHSETDDDPSVHDIYGN
jgi:hypothetical protein